MEDTRGEVPVKFVNVLGGADEGGADIGVGFQDVVLASGGVSELLEGGGGDLLTFRRGFSGCWEKTVVSFGDLWGCRWRDLPSHSAGINLRPQPRLMQTLIRGLQVPRVGTYYRAL